MTGSRAVRWFGSGDVRLVEFDPGEPGPGEVLVAVAYCGVCGSDLHEVLDGPHAIPTTTPHTLSGARAPLTLGHEFSGTVHAVGAGVTHVRPGDPVAVEPNYRCGRCTACQEGRYEVCAHFGFAGLMGNGGMAETAVVPGYMVHPLPEGFDLRAGAVLEPAAVALHAIRRSAWRPGQPALVVGLGPIGLLLCALVRAAGPSPVIGVDQVAERRERAEDLGVLALDVTDDVPAACRARTGGDGVAVAFEAVGSQPALDTALASVRSGGEVVLLGLTDTATIPVFDLINAEISLTTSVGYRDCHPTLIAMVAEGRLDLAGLVTRIVDLDDAVAMLHGLTRGGAGGVKTLVRCDAAA